MLQQTRVQAVIPYFERWLARFPTVEALAFATLDEVLPLWSGLGYYSRARNIHRAARQIVDEHGGKLPAEAAELRKLPGIGPYTAGAISSIAYGRQAPLVDGNVARVFARLYAIDGNIKSTTANRLLWRYAAELVPETDPGDFNQGLMELGATVCTPTRPSCLVCPIRRYCRAFAMGRQHDLPMMPARKRARDLPLIETSALWIEAPAAPPAAPIEAPAAPIGASSSGYLLMARRRPQGLYGGLWELPQGDDTQNALAILSAALADAIEVAADAPIAEHRQTLTHRRLQIKVFQARWREHSRPGAGRQRLPRLGKPRGGSYDKLSWHSLAELDQSGVSAATIAIVKHRIQNH